MSEARIHQIHVSEGGVPKLPVPEASVTAAGIVGDGHARPAIHGGPHQALCLFALERIEALAAEGHPIEPGSVGENITTAGLEWDRIEPGTRLGLGSDVRIEITGYAAPCRTIAGSFSDRRFQRLNESRSPGWSRLYARVLDGGVIRPGDPIRVELLEHDVQAGGDAHARGRPDGRSDPELELHPHGTGEPTMRMAYANVYVTDLDRSVAFFEKTLGLALQYAHPEFGYASFDAGPVRLGLARIDGDDEDARALVGRQTGLGFAVEDLRSRHAELAASGVDFTMKPSTQPWGGFMAMFADPDGNVFYLDEIATS